MLSRRGFLVTASASLVAAPLVANAQAPGKVPRIMFITTTSPPASPAIRAFLDALRDLGYVEGQNFGIEWRWGRGSTEQFGQFAAEASRLNVDVIVAVNSSAARAAQAATNTIPIVVTTMIDPVESGFVRSFARPGGNITGLTLRASALQGKRLQLFKEALPAAGLMAVLVEAGAQPLGDRAEMKETEAAARTLGVRLEPVVEVRNPGDLDAAFARLVRDGARAVFVVGGTMFFANRTRIAEQALKRRIPMICDVRPQAEAGCLMSYGPDLDALFRRTAGFVDRILKGAKPTDLPVEQPTKFELVINLKTAKALGLTIPPSLLLRADQVIE